MICNGGNRCYENCSRFLQQEMHIGTLKKIKFMNKYIHSWYRKIFSYLPKFGSPYQGVVFIDCMSNSGVYVFNNELHDGTSTKALKAFNWKHTEEKIVGKDFKIIVNDKDLQRITCQQCIWNNTPKINQKLTYDFFQKDVREFLKEDANKILLEAKKRKFHTLLFYDPYDLLIDWEALKPFLESKSVDIILTHFWMNDTKRAINQVVKEEAKNKYINAYGLSYEDLRERYNKMSSFEQNEFLRKQLIDQIMKHGANEKKFGYAPIFNDRNNVVYDIVIVSISNAATKLFRSEMYNLYKNVANSDGGTEQLSLFGTEDTSYSESRKLFNEMQLFYSYNYFAEVAASDFSGKEVSQENFNDYLNNHEFIAPNCKKELKKRLQEHHDMKIKKKTKNNPTMYKFK